MGDPALESSAAFSGDPTAVAVLAASATSQSSQERRKQREAFASDSSNTDASDPSGAHLAEARERVRGKLENADLRSSIFYLPKVLRSDVSGIVDRIVDAVVVIVALQHSNFLAAGFGRLLFIPVLVLCIYICSQLTYILETAMRALVLVRRQTEREHDSVEERSPEKLQHFLVRETLTRIRISYSQMAISLTRRLLYLVITYTTFMLVKLFIDWLTPSFSDGLFRIQKIFVFVLIIVPIFTELVITSYHQDLVATALHLKED